jgi:hypothetical protein
MSAFAIIVAFLLGMTIGGDIGPPALIAAPLLLLGIIIGWSLAS